MERIYEDRPVLDMGRARPDEKAEIQRWADDLLSGVSERQVIRDMKRRGGGCSPSRRRTGARCAARAR